MVGSFETYRGFVYLTSSGDAKNYGGKTCRYGEGGTEKVDFDIPTKISTSFFCLKGVSGMGGEGTLRRVES